MAVKQHVEVGGRQLALSNLDKVLYPGAAFTKAHVIDYYIQVSQWLPPHFTDRPVTLNRFPDGVRGKAFYEKDAPVRDRDRGKPHSSAPPTPPDMRVRIRRFGVTMANS